MEQNLVNKVDDEILDAIIDAELERLEEYRLDVAELGILIYDILSNPAYRGITREQVIEAYGRKMQREAAAIFAEPATETAEATPEK